MGQVNCHCNLSVNTARIPQHSLTNKPMVLSFAQLGHKRVKSRVNSILSPRELVRKHIKLNSNLQNINGIQNPFQCKLVISQGSQSKQILISSKTVSIRSAITNQLQKVGDKFDYYIKTNLDQDVYGFNAKSNQINRKIQIKSSNLGLGVFKWYSQDSQIEIKQNQKTCKSEVIDVGVGQFIVINTQKTQVNCEKKIHCLIFSKNAKPNSHQHKNTASNEKSIKEERRIFIGEGQTKLIISKILVTYFKNRIILKSVNQFGFYRYLQSYEELNKKDILRLGVSLYEVDIEQSHQTCYKFTAKNY